MATRQNVKDAIENLMVRFPNYNPVLEGEINVVSVFLEEFGSTPSDTFAEAIHDLGHEDGRKFAPSVGEIIHAIKEIPFKGLTPIERFEKENGIRPAYEVIQELGLNDVTEEEQRQKYLEQMKRKEANEQAIQQR